MYPSLKNRMQPNSLASFDVISSIVISQSSLFSTAKAGNPVIVNSAESVSLSIR